MFMDDVERLQAEATLKKILPEEVRKGGALTYHALEGFLFGICCVPDLIMPSEWIPVVWGSDKPKFKDNEEAERGVGALMFLYNHINSCILENRVFAACSSRPELPPMRNFDADSAYGQWSRGYALSQLLSGSEDWISREELDQVGDDFAEDYSMSCIILAFFADKTAMKKLSKKGELGPHSLEEVADMFIRNIDSAMNIQAAFRRACQSEPFDS